MKVWLGAVLTACIIVMGAGDARAQVPCSTSPNPYTGGDDYACTISGEAAGQPLLVDCRRQATVDDFGLATQRGCTLTAAGHTLDVQRCSGRSDWGQSTEVCRTNAFKQGYDCTRKGVSEGDGQHFSSRTDTRCHARLGAFGQKVDSVCDERLTMSSSGYEFTDSCTTTVTTFLATVRCTHDPVVPLDYFLDTARYATYAPSGGDSETAVPACSRV